jgi:uncharacterized protein (DUF169 family)
MDITFKERFIRLWNAYFPGAELPIVFYYANRCPSADAVPPADEWRCFVSQLGDVRRGESLCFETSAIGCAGGRRYTGFSTELMPDFEYFLSCGIPGKIEGERYKKSPEIVREVLDHWPDLLAPARYLVFKRWDRLEAEDEPDVVIFYAPPDILSGLFTLANFEETDPNSVLAPMAAGCATMVMYPYLEKDNDRPRAVLGLFDPSARSWVKPDILSFAVPMRKFVQMVNNMSDSFLATQTWERIRHRMTAPAHETV